MTCFKPITGSSVVFQSHHRGRLTVARKDCHFEVISEVLKNEKDSEERGMLKIAIQDYTKILS